MRDEASAPTIWRQILRAGIISALPLALATGAGWIFAEYTVAAYEPELPATLSAGFSDSLRAGYLRFFALWVVVLGAHWLASGALGRGNVGKVRSANAFIAIAIISGIAAPMQSAFALDLTGIRSPVCEALGIAVSFPPLPEGVVRFDGVTDCESFGFTVAFATMFFIPLGLILLATAARVIVSRKQHRVSY